VPSRHPATDVQEGVILLTMQLSVFSILIAPFLTISVVSAYHAAPFLPMYIENAKVDTMKLRQSGRVKTLFLSSQLSLRLKLQEWQTSTTSQFPYTRRLLREDTAYETNNIRRVTYGQLFMRDDQAPVFPPHRLPIGGQIEFDIDIRKARWYDSWVGRLRRDSLPNDGESVRGE